MRGKQVGILTLVDPLMDKDAELEGKPAAQIEKFVNSLSGHDKSRLWGIMKTSINSEGREALAIWEAVCTGKDQQKKKNYCLRAWIEDPSFTTRFFNDTHTVTLSDEWKRKIKPMTYGEMYNKFGKQRHI